MPSVLDLLLTNEGAILAATSGYVAVFLGWVLVSLFSRSSVARPADPGPICPGTDADAVGRILASVGTLDAEPPIRPSHPLAFDPVDTVAGPPTPRLLSSRPAVVWSLAPRTDA